MYTKVTSAAAEYSRPRSQITIQVFLTFTTATIPSSVLLHKMLAPLLYGHKKRSDITV